MALTAAQINPDETGYVVAALIAASILDIDHLAYVIRDWQMYRREGFAGNLHNARSSFHELLGLLAAGIVAGGLWFIDTRLASVVLIAFTVHLLEDWFLGKSLRDPSERDYSIKPRAGDDSGTVWLQAEDVTAFAGPLTQAADDREAQKLRKIVTAGDAVTHRVWIREREEAFEFPAETKPLLVRFDPENVLLKELVFQKQRDELLYKLSHDYVIGRMSAATDLAQFKDDPVALTGLADSAQSDLFWAVRRAAIEALAKAAGASSGAVTKKAVLDRHPSVRIAALAALGDLKDRSLLEFFKERFAKDGSDAVRAESIRPIGKLGDPSTVPFLEQCAAVTSYRNLIATATKQAIAAAGMKYARMTGSSPWATGSFMEGLPTRGPP